MRNLSLPRLVAAGLLLLAATPCWAQRVWPDPNATGVVGGQVPMCLNGSSQAVPCSASTPLAVAGGAYPSGATPITATFSGADTSSSAATLAAAAGKTTYICGFTVSGLGATALTNVTVAVTGLTGAGTLNYTYSMPAGATVAATPLNVPLSPCVPGNAVNTAIVVTVPGGAGNTNTTISAQGYQL